jgi:hypothetical protein
VQLHLGLDLRCAVGDVDADPYVLGGIEDWDVDDPASQSLEKVPGSATTSSGASATVDHEVLRVGFGT